MRRSLVAAVVAACCLATACSGDDSPEEPAGSAAGARGLAPATWKEASTLAAGHDTLDWQRDDLPRSGFAAGTRDWTGAADSLGEHVTLTGPDDTITYAPRRGRVQSIEMQWPWAVVYAGGDLTEQGAGSGELVVFDLRTGERRMVGQDGTAPPPSPAGSISMHDGTLAYPTGPNHRYCLARLDLRTLGGERVDCAKPLKEGFTQFRLTPRGLGYTSFDDKRPAPCLTLKAVRNGDTGVVDAAKPCVGWEVVPGADSALWLQIRNRHRVELAHAYARNPDGSVVDLGPALSGSTSWCGDATYFVRPASKDGTADDLMRWSPQDGLDVVWTPSDDDVAFVFSPHCGGSSITLPALNAEHDPILLSAQV